METSAEFAACVPRLRRYARALLSDRAAADDLTQDTLERAWAKLDQFRPGSDLRAWMFSIMHNVHVSRLRRPQPEEALVEDSLDAGVRATQNDALEIRDLDRALAALSMEHREVLLLIGLEEMSYDAAASTLGIPVGTVMSRLSRARERLRVLMAGTTPNQKLQIVKSRT